MITMGRLPLVLLYSQEKMTDSARAHTRKGTGGRCPVGSEINSGRCHRAHKTPSTNAAQRAFSRSCSLGRAKPRQPTSSKSPTMIKVDRKKKPIACQSVYAPVLCAGAPAAMTAAINGPNGTSGLLVEFK